MPGFWQPRQKGIPKGKTMKDKPLFDLENQFEADLISEVLRDNDIPFRIDYASNNYWGILMGEGANFMGPFAKLWGYVRDKQRIGELLDEVRASTPLEK